MQNLQILHVKKEVNKKAGQRMQRARRKAADPVEDLGHG